MTDKPTILLYNLDKLRNAIEQGVTILSPNRRIANKIQQAWSVEQSQAVPVATIYALEDWLNHLNSKLPLPRILNHYETALLWHQVLTKIEYDLLMPANSVAELVMSADDLLQQWQIDYPTLPDDADSQFLKQAINQFEQKLEAIGSTTFYRACIQLEHAIQSGKVSPPKKIILEGFDDITPLINGLFQTCIQMGSDIQQNPAPAQNQHSCAVQCTDAEQELYAAVCWAYEQYQQEPNSTIGIIIPDLNIRRREVERVLQEIFEPQYLLPSVTRYNIPFNISAGEPLSQQPIIDSALKLLTLHQGPHSLNFLLSLLHSPFWGEFFSDNQQELDYRKQAEINLRDLQWNQLSLANLKQALNKESGLLSRLNRCVDLTGKSHLAHYPSAWLDLIQKQLQILGWPGQRRLDSIEFQQVKQWQTVLDEFALLDDLLSQIPLSQALTTISLLTEKAIFQAQTPDCPVQLLGLLEGSGLHFDKLWVCGLSELNWPAVPDPHPLLPINLQIHHDMPHCSVQREQHYADAVNQRLLGNAKEAIFSWSANKENSDVQLAKPFRHLPTTPIDKLIKTLYRQHPYNNYSYHFSGNELINDSYGPVLENTTLKGGQGMLKAQALNPFDAFAQYRLHLKPLREISLGLPRTLRGELIHYSLQAIWQILTSQDVLLALTANDKKQLIEQSLESSFRKIKHHSLHNEVFRSIELEQLELLINQWLQIESRREPFTVIALEKTMTLSVNGITIKLIIDRIDQLKDGGLLLIDYKTTATQLSTSSWQQESLTEPQLPLYALASAQSNQPPAGISYAQVNLDTLRFVSLGNSSDIPNNKINDDETWRSIQFQWKQQLEALMEEIKQGLATVEYRHSNITSYSEIFYSFNRWPERNYIHSLLAQENDK